MPEFGRSTGGIFNLVLRSGGNELHGDVFVNASPGFLRATSGRLHRAGEAIASRGRSAARSGCRVRHRRAAREDAALVLRRVQPAVHVDRRVTHLPGRASTSSSRTRTARRSRARRTASRTSIPRPGSSGSSRSGARTTTARAASICSPRKLTLAVDARSPDLARVLRQPGGDLGVSAARGRFASRTGVSGSPGYYNGERSGGSHNVVLTYAGQFSEGRFRVEAFAGYPHERDVVENRATSPCASSSTSRSLDDLEPGHCPPEPRHAVHRLPRHRLSQRRDGLPYRRRAHALGRRREAHQPARGAHQIRYGLEVEYKVYYRDDRILGQRLHGFDFGPSAVDDPYTNERDYFARVDAMGNTVLLDTDGNEPLSATVGTLTTSAFLQDLVAGQRLSQRRWRPPLGPRVASRTPRARRPSRSRTNSRPASASSFDPTGVGQAAASMPRTVGSTSRSRWISTCGRSPRRERRSDSRTIPVTRRRRSSASTRTATRSPVVRRGRRLHVRPVRRPRRRELSGRQRASGAVPRRVRARGGVRGHRQLDRWGKRRGAPPLARGRGHLARRRQQLLHREPG